MAELEPFSDSCDDFELELLRSTRVDAPRPGAAAKTLLALGLLPTSAAAAGAATAGHALTAWSILKGLGVGLLAGGGLVFVSELALAPAPSPHAALHVSREAEARLRPATALPPAAVPAAQPVSPSPATSANPARRVDSQREASATFARDPDLASLPRGEAAFAPSPGSEPATDERPSDASLAEQVNVIDAARRSLKHGRPSEALAQARSYEQRWPTGPLAIEAVIVRIEAELALGDRAAAERDARRVIVALPGGRYAARVRQLFSPPLAE